MNEMPITINGYKKLEEELSNLKKIERPKITQAIATARAHGDLKENAEYHTAKDQQGMVEARIRKLEATLSSSKIIDYLKLSPEDRIIFGATVTLVNIETDAELTYQIVGEEEADIEKHTISVTSPVARGVIGKNIGDIVSIHTPNGETKYEITTIQYI